MGSHLETGTAGPSPSLRDLRPSPAHLVSPARELDFLHVCSVLPKARVPRGKKQGLLDLNTWTQGIASSIFYGKVIPGPGQVQEEGTKDPPPRKLTSLSSTCPAHRMYSLNKFRMTKRTRSSLSPIRTSSGSSPHRLFREIIVQDHWTRTCVEWPFRSLR